MNNNKNHFWFRQNEICQFDRTLQLNIIVEDSRCVIRAVPENSICEEFEAAIVELVTVSVDSTMLCKSSSFFLKLFRSVMRESQLQVFQLLIAKSEMGAFLELLSFVHLNEVNVKSAGECMQVLVMADKYDVPKCKKLCIKQLLEMPVTKEVAGLCKELPEGVFMDLAGAQLLAAAEKFIDDRKAHEQIPTKYPPMKMKPKYQ